MERGLELSQSASARVRLEGAGARGGSDSCARRPIAPQVHRMLLDNGIPVYVIENHLAPAVFIGGMIETGNMPEANPGGKPGVDDDARRRHESWNGGHGPMRS